LALFSSFTQNLKDVCYFFIPVVSKYNMCKKHICTTEHFSHDGGKTAGSTHWIVKELPVTSLPQQLYHVLYFPAIKPVPKAFTTPCIVCFPRMAIFVELV
jgi:hypothetical protein